jgi:hypothetical protein
MRASRGRTLPRKSNRPYSKLPAEPKDSAMYKRGGEIVAVTLAEMKEKHIRGLVTKVGTIDRNTQYEVQTLPLYQPVDRSGSTSNISSRMSPPVPTIKSLLKTGSRRHKVKSYRQTRNSPYVRLVQSNLNINRKCSHKKEQTFCAICIMREWVDAYPFVQDKMVMIDEVMVPVRTFSVNPPPAARPQ